MKLHVKMGSNIPVMPDDVNSKNIGKYIANVWISCVPICCCLRRRPAIKQTKKWSISFDSLPLEVTH